MSKTAVAMALAVAALIAPARAQDAKGVIAEALGALGASDLASVSVSGVAAEGNFGQSRTISFGLASTSFANFTQTFDFAGSRARTTGTPKTGTPLDRSIAPGAGWPEQFEIWTTPWGFLRGAAAASPSLKRQRIEGVEYRVITWTPPHTSPSGEPYRVVGYINPESLLTRVETWVEHPIFGDMHVETRFTEYRNFGGIGAPTRIARRLVGMETFVMAIGSVRANPADLMPLLTAAAPAPRPATQAPPTAAEKLAEGVYRIAGSYVALAVEFRDHLVIVEAGGDEARGLAVLAETKRLFPGKRVRYVVNTHPHFDHAGGLPPLVADGITIIADDPSRYFLEQALRSPRTLVGDALSKSKRKATVESVIEKRVLTDGSRTLELHHVERLDHSDAMLLAYLPKERILFTADFELPEAGARASPSIEALARNVDRLQLEFDRHVAVHAGASDRALTRAGLRALAGLDQ